MKIEVEVKFCLYENASEIRNQLLGIADKQENDFVTDRYFVINQDGCSVGDRIRIREKDNIFLITYKKNSRNIRFKRFDKYYYQVCDEIEFTIDNEDDFIKFLSEIGFGYYKTIEKNRSKFFMGEIIAELNIVKDLGTFLEIERQCQEEKQILPMYGRYF